MIFICPNCNSPLASVDGVYYFHPTLSTCIYYLHTFVRPSYG